MEDFSVGFSAVCATFLLAAALAALLRSFGAKCAPVFACVCITTALTRSIGALAPLSSLLDSLASSQGIAEQAKDVMRVVGIGYLSGITSDVCRELGEAGIARTVGIVARLELLTIALPYVEKIIAAAMKLGG